MPRENPGLPAVEVGWPQDAAAEGSGCLVLCPTPIGNMGDITLRALQALREADLVLAEDTRQTLKLLRHYGIQARLVSYHEHNERQRAAQALGWLKEGRRLVLVSDAGSPAVADPGFHLVRLALASSIPVTALPGPSALVPALTSSGLPPQPFVFLGFLPRKAGPRRRLLERARDLGWTAVAYESPHRLVETLEEVVAVLGAGCPCAVARELTKTHEELVRGTAEEVLARFRASAPRGECVLLLGGERAAKGNEEG